MKHEHVWKRVEPPIVNPVGQSGQTYNAECECGARAWLHWPPR